MKFAGLPSVLYEVQVSDDLKTWMTVATITSGPDGVIDYLDANAAQLSR